MAEEKQIICDSCDAEIPADSEICPVCGVKIKDTGQEKDEEEESLDEVMEYIIGEEDDDEILDKIKTIGSSTKEAAEESFLEEEVIGEDFVEDEFDEETEETIEEYEEEEEEVVEFECPVCGTIVSEEDSKCPNCGAIFETEEEGVEPEKLEELEEGMDYVEDELEELADSNIDLTYLNNGLNDLIDSYEESRYEEGLEILGVLKTQIKDFRKIIKLTENSNNCINTISDKTDTKAFEKRLDSIIDKAEVGEYKPSLKEAKELNQELEQIRSEYEEEKEEVKKEFESKMKNAKKHLNKVRGKKIDISDIKNCMKKAVSSKKKNEYSEGIEHAEDVITKSESVLEVIDLIEAGKDKIRKLKNEGASYSQYLEKLKKGKSEADESEYDLSIETLEAVLDELEEELKKIEEKEIKETEEKKKKEIKKEELMGDLDEILEEAKQNMKKVRKTKISVPSVKNTFKNAVQAKNKEKYEEAIKKAEEVNKRAEKILEVSEMIDEARSKIKDLKDKGIEPQKFLDELKEVREKADNGDFKDSIKKCEDLIDELEEAIVEAEQKEKEKEKLSGEIQELDSKFDDLLEEADNLNVDTKEAVDLKQSAVKNREEGDIEKGMDQLKSAIEKIHESIEDEVEEKLMELELNLEDGWDEEATKTAQNLIDSIRDKIEEKRYEDILELLDEAEDKAEEALGPISKLEEKISNTDEIIFEVKILEYDVSDAEEELEKAKEELELGDWDEAEKHLESAEDMIADKIPELLKSNIKKSRDELRKAKIKGIDISGAVSLLKEVKNAQKDDEYTKAFEKYQQFKEEMEDIKEKY